MRNATIVLSFMILYDILKVFAMIKRVQTKIRSVFFLTMAKVRIHIKPKNRISVKSILSLMYASGTEAKRRDMMFTSFASAVGAPDAI